MLPTRKYNNILLDGTSSAGKSSIGKILATYGYVLSSADDLENKKVRLGVQKRMDLSRYYSEQEMKELYESVIAELMRIKEKAVVYDDIVQTIATQYPEDKIFIIVVYTSLENLIRNIKARAEIEPRLSVGAFKQFSERYIVTNEIDGIDRVNRRVFGEKLEKEMKYLFESKERLTKFVEDVFGKMGIYDDDYHFIKLRENYRCDYLLKVGVRSLDEVTKELEQFIC
uniref:Cytidylate kinase n=1 Tax=viral metagenome TaxID=1070528 RepID=A0A6C0C825_9ZZZZ